MLLDTKREIKWDADNNIFSKYNTHFGTPTKCLTTKQLTTKQQQTKYLKTKQLTTKCLMRQNV